jgi:RND family efflux transporter MFP subunit
MSALSFPHRRPRAGRNSAGNKPSFRFALSLLLVAFLLSGCGKAAAKRAAPEPEVMVTTPVTGWVADYQDFTGRLSAVKTIEIRARVSGYVMVALGADNHPIKEGDVVHKGQLIFQIDERPYRADYNQAVANVKLAEADRNLQEKNAVRARELVTRKGMSQEDYETVLATYEKSKATVRAMEAAREKAKVYLDFTKVTAPETGRISRRYVDPGNLVTADNTVLTTIVTENPMFANFDVDERTYLELLVKAVTDPSAWFTGLQFPVLLRLTTEQDFVHAGIINFVDNQVNPSTGTIRMRGVFDNPTGILKSGLFVRVRLPIGRPYESMLITDEALQSDQGRKFVFVVTDKIDPDTKKPGPVVEYRSVEVGQAITGLSAIKKEPSKKDFERDADLPKQIVLRVVKGLSKNDRVVINGMQRVRHGSKVQVKMETPPTPVVSSLVKLLSGNQPLQAPPPGDKGTRKQGEKQTKLQSQ